MSFEKQKLIMLPGPTNVSERVMKAMTRPIINHRGPEFAKLFLGLREKARSLFQTEGEVILFSSSGTGGVEAAVWNIIRKGDIAIVPVFGEFSERLAETIELAGGRAVRVKAGAGPDASPLAANAVDAIAIAAIARFIVKPSRDIAELRFGLELVI